MPFSSLDPIRWIWTGPRPAPTPKVDMNTLSSNPIVVQLQNTIYPQREYTVLDLATKVGKPVSALAPVLREMQRAGMIEAGRFHPGLRTLYYRLPVKP